MPFGTEISGHEGPTRHGTRNSPLFQWAYLTFNIHIRPRTLLEKMAQKLKHEPLAFGANLRPWAHACWTAFYALAILNNP